MLLGGGVADRSRQLFTLFPGTAKVLIDVDGAVHMCPSPTVSDWDTITSMGQGHLSYLLVDALSPVNHKGLHQG